MRSCGAPIAADDLKQTGSQDDARINVEQEHELSYWSERLGVSRGDGLELLEIESGMHPSV
jgi:Protein of unknown function (DUF3606)